MRPEVAVLACLIAFVSFICGMPRAALAGDSADCAETLTDFAAGHGVTYDFVDVVVSDRWAGAGHEVQRLPGLRVRLPVERCGGALVVDLTEDCRIVRSRGEGGCRRAFPTTFY